MCRPALGSNYGMFVLNMTQKMLDFVLLSGEDVDQFL